MTRHIQAEEDRWAVRLASERPEPGQRAIIFFCETTDQRPYRVATVEEGRVSSTEGLEALSEHELQELFASAQSMGRTTSRASWG